MRPNFGSAQPDSEPDDVWNAYEGASVVATIRVDESGAILGVNPTFAEALGAAPGRLIRQSVFEILSDTQDRDKWRTAQGAGGARGLELGFLGANGRRTLRGDLLAQPLASGGRAFGGVFVDISEEVHLRKAIQRSARLEALGSLTSGVAHDFNNLLTVLVGNLSLAAEELRAHANVFAKLKSARDAARRGSDLIRQLLTFARRDSIDEDVLDPGRVVYDLTELLRRALGARIELVTDIEPDAGPVRGSVAILESAIVNLAVNARDAIAARGRVSLTVRRVHREQRTVAAGRLPAGDYVEVAVEDDGQGMSPDVAARVFEPFFSTKREQGGTGLGLSMVRAFAEQAGGSVAIESEIGRGTTVRIDLPRCVDAVEETAARTMPLSTLPSGDEKVLVLAREEALRATVSQILEVLGYDVTLLDDVATTCAALSGDAAPLLIVDGTLVDELVASQPGLIGAARSVVLTAGADKPLGPLSMTLRKPFSLADLAGAVRGTLDREPARSE